MTPIYRLKQPPITAWKFDPKEALLGTAPEWFMNIVRVWTPDSTGVPINNLRFTIDGKRELVAGQWVVFSDKGAVVLAEVDFVRLYELDPAPKAINADTNSILAN